MKLFWEYELSDEVMVNKSKNNYYSELLSWVCLSIILEICTNVLGD